MNSIFSNFQILLHALTWSQGMEVYSRFYKINTLLQQLLNITVFMLFIPLTSQIPVTCCITGAAGKAVTYQLYCGQ